MNSPDPIQLTRALLNFNTINPPGLEYNCAQYLAGMLSAVGFQVASYEFAPQRTSIIARLQGVSDRPPLCFTGHLDTVPLGATPWQYDPFAGETAGDRLYGRGATDMKGGVAAMVATGIQLGQLPELKAGLVLVITAGEETCLQGAYHLASLEGVLGTAGAIVVGEPTGNYPWIGHKGVVRFEITLRGVTAHASMPEEGINAIHKGAAAVLKLQDYQFQVMPHPLLGKPTLNIGTIAGGLNINSVPDRCVLGIDIRTIPGQDHQSIQAELQALLGPEAEIKLIEQAPSIASPSQDQWLETVFGITAPYLPHPPTPQGAPFVTDAAVLRPAYGNPPTVILGPGEPTLAHKTDEYCHLSKIRAITEIYRQIAEAWCLA
ncbi:MAG: M20 family metallopeptidase [Pseudanabaenaceae cyanobacterium]